MANSQDNLIPLNKRTKNKQREIARQGGIASGKVRKEKATMKATLEMLLNETSKNGKTYKELVTLGLLKGAINGNAKNYEVILQTLGELLQVEQAKDRITIVNNLGDNDGS